MITSGELYDLEDEAKAVGVTPKRLREIVAELIADLHRQRELLSELVAFRESLQHDRVMQKLKEIQDCWQVEKRALQDEIERLTSGFFTEQEFQDLCHGFDDSDRERFEEKLFGSKDAC